MSIQNHFLLFIVCTFLISPVRSAQMLPELTEPDGTYLRFYGGPPFNIGTSRAAGDSVFTLLGRWAWGYCLAAQAKDQYAFIGNGATFQTLDMTNPAAPVIAGEFIVANRINDIVVRGDLAYVAVATGLAVMDITEPTDPHQIGELSLGGIPQQVVVEDSFAYVLSWGSGVMHIVDVGDPVQPVRRGGFASGEFAYCIAVHSRYVYLGIPNVPAGILRIVDATNPDLPTFRDTTLGFISRTATTRDTLLLIGATPITGPLRTLKVLSVANPAHPRILGEVIVPGRSGNTGGISVVGTRAYLAVLDTGIVEVDIADPLQPQIQRVLHRKPLFAASGITSVSGIGMAPMGDNLIVPYYTGLLTINKAQTDSLNEVSFFPTGGPAFDVQVRNGVAYLASLLAGLWIVDVSDPYQPRPLSNVQNGGPVMSVLLSDSLTFLVNTPGSQSDTTRGLWVVDIADTTQPNLLDHYVGISSSHPSYTAANPATLMGSLVVLGRRNGSANDSTLEIVDASDPRDIQRLSVVRGSYSPAFLACKDSIVFVSTTDSGVILFDAHIPGAPDRIGRFLTYSGGIFVEDTLLVVMSDSLYTYSVRTPSLPVRLGSTVPSLPNAISFKMARSQQFLYLAQEDVLAYDISTPRSPVEVGVLKTLGSATGVAAAGDQVFVADALFGLWVLRNDRVTSIKEDQPIGISSQYDLYQNYPNPFNATTLIPFYLPERDKVTIELFDVLGQRVYVSLDDVKQKGMHVLRLDGGLLPSGVYFYRLKSSTGSLTRKMMITK